MAGIESKSPREIQLMREAGEIVAEALEIARQMMLPGVTTGELDDAIAAHIRAHGGVPTFLGQYGFPQNVCISLNEQVVHGIPGRRALAAGDLVSIDVGCTRRKFIADSAWTFAVGEVSDEARRLLAVGEQALNDGLAVIRDGARLVDVSRAIQTVAERAGYSVVRDFVGHGVGRKLHEPPQIPNYVPRKEKINPLVLRTGMTLAIEPMVNVGTHRVKRLKDGWTMVTADRKLSVHFEHTVAVTADGFQVLTALPEPEEQTLNSPPSRRTADCG